MFKVSNTSYQRGWCLSNLKPCKHLLSVHFVLLQNLNHLLPIVLIGIRHILPPLEPQPPSPYTASPYPSLPWVISSVPPPLPNLIITYSQFCPLMRDGRTLGLLLSHTKVFPSLFPPLLLSVYHNMLKS